MATRTSFIIKLEMHLACKSNPSLSVPQCGKTWSPVKEYSAFEDVSLLSFICLII